MKLFYHSRYIALSSGIFNFLSGLFTATLISLIIYYQFGVLVANNYSSLAPNLGIEWGPEISKGYNASYIEANNYSGFFQSPLSIGGTWWDLIYPFFILTVLTVVFRTFLSLITLYAGIRNKHTLLTTSSIITIFIPFVGLFSSLLMFRKTKELFKDAKQQKTKVSKLKELQKTIESKINTTEKVLKK